MKYFGFYLREYLFPIGCGGCGEALFQKEDAYYGLCAECREFLSFALETGRRCEICGKHLISEKDSCLSCRKADGSTIYNEQIVKLKALFPYTGKFKAVLGAFKFGKSIGVGNFLTVCLNQVLEDFDRETIKNAKRQRAACAWVPVPPRPGKVKKQGWDQIEFLAKSLGKTSSLPLRRCLKRLPSRSQKELNRQERETNLKGHIICAKPPPGIAILFDDVITTGATMNACAAALIKGGATKVYGICLFYN